MNKIRNSLNSFQFIVDTIQDFLYDHVSSMESFQNQFYEELDKETNFFNDFFLFLKCFIF